MVNDLEWLKEEVMKISENFNGDGRSFFANGLDRAVGETVKLIDQIEPIREFEKTVIDKIEINEEELTNTITRYQELGYDVDVRCIYKRGLYTGSPFATYQINILKPVVHNEGDSDA